MKNISKIDPIKILKKYYDSNSRVYKVILEHSKQVEKKALEIANKQEKKVDLKFLKEICILHDIGIFLVDYPELDIKTGEDFLRHGILGANILRKEKLSRHAKAVERHIGVGITKEEIIKNNLQLPKRDFIPKQIEEKILCLADLYFSKTGKYRKKEKSLSVIKEQYRKFGKEKIKKLESLISELQGV